MLINIMIEKGQKKKLIYQRRLSYIQQQSQTVEEKSNRIIRENLQSLNAVIEEMDKKIQMKIQRNQIKILYAYKNHLKKVTKEVKAIKERYEAFQKRYSSDQQILHLKKQCALFRQEAMRLSNSLQDSMEEAQIYKRKVKLLDEQVVSNTKKIKEMLLKLKQAQIQTQRLRQEISEKEILLDQINNQIREDDRFKRFKTESLPRKDQQSEEFTLSNKNFNQKFKTTVMTVYPHSLQEPQRVKTARVSNYFNQTMFSNYRPTSFQKSGNFLTQVVENQLQNFEMFMGLIQQTRLREKFQAQSFLSSKTIQQFLYCDKDILKLVEKMFIGLEISTESSPTGIKFSAVQKKDKKKQFVYLSTKIMKQIENKKATTQILRKKTRSQQNIQHITQDTLNIKISDQEITKQNKINKLEASFKLKRFMKNHRKLNLKDLQR